MTGRPSENALLGQPPRKGLYKIPHGSLFTLEMNVERFDFLQESVSVNIEHSCSLRLVPVANPQGALDIAAFEYLARLEKPLV